MSSSASFAPLIARLRRESGHMPAWSSMELMCKLMVESTRRTMIVFDSCRVAVVANHCMVEDRVDRCSS